MQKLMNDRCLFETRFADGTEGPNVFLDVLASPHTGQQGFKVSPNNPDIPDGLADGYGGPQGSPQL